MTQNVVTYTVVINTHNSDGRLKPYLTANVRFEVTKHSNALLVSNGALRWKPAPQQVAPEARDEYAREQASKSKQLMSQKPPPETQKVPNEGGTLWVQQDGGFVVPITVRTGLCAGPMTEIIGGDVREGTFVVVGENRSAAGAAVKNPFTPKLFGDKK
jgi:HlyD family secretion protein